MLPAWLALAVFGAVVAVLLCVAVRADRWVRRREPALRRGLIYALAICVSCSSWSYFNSIGTASRHGLDFLPMYLGPAILFGLFHPVIIRIIRLSKGQNLTSIADFIAVRYGELTSVAVVVTLIVTFGSIPFLSLQLRVLARSLGIFLDGALPLRDATHAPDALEAGITLVMAALTITIATRRLVPNDLNRGLLLAVATGSIVKFVAFLGLGAFVCWGMYKGVGDLTAHVAGDPIIAATIDAAPTSSHWLSAIVFSCALTLVLPFTFFASVVGNRQEADIRTAAWVVPLYILAVGIMIMPIAAAGLASLPAASFDRDLTMFALPIHANAEVFTIIALIGATAAATATILVATTALSLIVANDLAIPLCLAALQRRDASIASLPSAPPILMIRRLAILGILGLAWLCSYCVTNRHLSSLALTSLVCVVQVAPAMIGGLVWDRGTSRGALAGCGAGVLVWGYTLLLPSVNSGASPLVADGPLGFDRLRPTDLFSIDLAPFDQGVFWSLAINISAYVVISLTRRANAEERLQADLYVRNRPVAFSPSLQRRPFDLTTGALVGTTSLYVGADAAEALFADYHSARGLTLDRIRDADAPLLKFAKGQLTSVIGAASSRTVISRLLDRHGPPDETAMRIVDDVALELHSSHDVLQHAIDIARDGMAVFDGDLRLVAWNRAYREMFQLPGDLMRVGTPLDALVRSNAKRGIYGPGTTDAAIANRLEALTRPTDSLRLHGAPFDRVLEMHSVRLNNGGLFFTYTDATAQVRSEADLEAENITLERRVRERTEDLETLNFELERAKAEADDANVSKTRFLAAASHDLLQPLNAARLYTTSLRERLRGGSTGEDADMLATHIDASLEAVEDILSALLEISHLDAGATKTEITSFPIESVLRQLQIEFVPLAKAQGLRLRINGSSAWVASDRRLLSRLLQNLVSNAIKYTMEGRVLVGVRHQAGAIRVEVHDTGLGIPESKQILIFREFERLAPAIRVASGAGLGLSIVERLGRMLQHEIKVRSQLGSGSIFSVTLPRAAVIPAVLSGSSTITAVTRQRSLEGLVVVAIDNERHILAGMDMLLQGWDCVVATGAGLPEIEGALWALDLSPDVILADFHIGEVDGLGVIAALRARFGPCPAVIITADRDPAIRDRAHAVDVRVLHKPLKPAALRALLSQWRLVKAAAE